MDPLTVLAWIGVALAGLILVGILGGLLLIAWAAIVGLRRMRDDQDKPELTILTGRSDR